MVAASSTSWREIGDASEASLSADLEEFCSPTVAEAGAIFMGRDRICS